MIKNVTCTYSREQEIPKFCQKVISSGTTNHKWQISNDGTLHVGGHLVGFDLPKSIYQECVKHYGLSGMTS